MLMTTASAQASPNLFDFTLTGLDGKPMPLEQFRCHPVLLVNTASECGFTPQYEGLEKLYQRLHGKGLQVLGFPCNDFAAQEPGTEADIEAFCSLNYGVSFPMFSKVNTNTEPRHPLYAALIAAKPQATVSGDGKLQAKLAQHGLSPKAPTDVMWNFEKFLIGRDGQVLGRFAPDVAPDAPGTEGNCSPGRL